MKLIEYIYKYRNNLILENRINKYNYDILHINIYLFYYLFNNFNIYINSIDNSTNMIYKNNEIKITLYTYNSDRYYIIKINKIYTINVFYLNEEIKYKVLSFIL